MKKLQKYLIAGLLVWLPIVVTVLLFRFLITLMDQTLILLPSQIRPEAVIGFKLPGLGLILTLLVLIVTGIFAANFVGKSMVNFGEKIFKKIPIVRSVYSAAKNFADIVFSDTGQSFKKVLLIQYPRKGVYSLAFQTSTNLGEVQKKTGSDVVCTFVPTTPNPTSGFIIIIPKEDVIEMDMEVDEAFKMIVSLGVVVPEWKKEELETLSK
ncbi:MAG: DUF502 domain-containing protein [Gammaproteobacteria bacterium]|jgi:uncharacterized membrane protein|nr:MAG: DUF502 domain-containing protein [Gammaproteobacteria bacterium]|tara:strand:- start:2389 stop:3018 length:630 start_codon:yes stop_codon:yes gene_type:complete